LFTYLFVLLSLLIILSSLLIYFLAHLLHDLATSFPFRFEAKGDGRRPNLALVCVVILCRSIFSHGCMFAFVVFGYVFQYQAKTLAGKNVYLQNELFCVKWDVKP